MRPALLRALLAITTFVVVWLVAPSAARAAGAQAPLCDSRGAITFAPPPQIQDEERSLDIVSTDCAAPGLLDGDNVLPGRGPQGDFSISQEPVATGAVTLPRRPVSERAPFESLPSARPPRGVHRSIERPPRA